MYESITFPNEEMYVIGGRLRKGGKLPLKDLYRLIWRGAFPAVALSHEVDRDFFYSYYVQSY